MEKFQKMYANLVVMAAKVHTYHIMTVNLPGCATIHPTLGGIYNSLEEIVDRFGENVIIKYLRKTLPTPMECYKESSYCQCECTNAQDIVAELFDEIENMENDLADMNNDADNCLAQLLSPIRDKFTGFCADLMREINEG